MNIVRSATLAAAVAAGFSLTSPALAQDRDDSGDRLGRTIERAIEADGPWLLPAEQALIARKCGYPAGTRDSDSVTINNGVLICANGRRVDDPEVRVMMAAAGPRISRRVQAVMESPAVKDALALVASGAVQRALESLGDELPPRDRRRRR
jgi:hypothetical protein